MFYPVESLKKGGRFYFCWVADSWPLRFATITHRQLLSQDVPSICEELLQVMRTESGRAAQRFSLRLSSQLMRGLVRLYQRKVTIFLGELCMLNANVSKHVNKKFVMPEQMPARRPALPRITIAPPEEEHGVEERIQNSGNVVANIEEITLKESTLPNAQPLLNDNFGEVHPDQALQLLADRTLEQMLAQDVSAVQQSLELPLDFSTDKSHDKSRLAPHDPQMEMIYEHDVTMFRKSVGDELLPIDDVIKEIPGTPELTKTLPPVQPDPQPDQQLPENVMEVEKEVPTEAAVVVDPEDPKEFVLEELEEVQPPAKRRRVKSKIVDKHIKLTTSFMRARLEACRVELRCRTGREDIVNIYVPANILLSRPAHSDPRVGTAVGSTLNRLFLRNLGVVHRTPLADREMEVPLAGGKGKSHRSSLERIVEEPETLEPVDKDRMRQEIAEPLEPRVQSAAGDANIADMPTQVIETLSQEARKRSLEPELTASPKMARRCGYVSLRESQARRLTAFDTAPHAEAETEIIPDNIPPVFRESQTETDLMTLTSMLQEVGLADVPQRTAAEASCKGPSPKGLSPKPPQRPHRASEGSETPLGSLDRTKVSLGDSEQTTDSKKIISEQWGTVGTMLKVLAGARAGARPLGVAALLARGPAPHGRGRLVAARCFTSLLKLKQHGFIKIEKHPVTLEIIHITLGPKFD